MLFLLYFGSPVCYVSLLFYSIRKKKEKKEKSSTDTNFQIQDKGVFERVIWNLFYLTLMDASFAKIIGADQPNDLEERKTEKN